MEYSSQQIAEVLKELGMDDELIAYMTKRGQRQKQIFHASRGDPAFLLIAGIFIAMIKLSIYNIEALYR